MTMIIIDGFARIIWPIFKSFKNKDIASSIFINQKKIPSKYGIIKHKKANGNNMKLTYGTKKTFISGLNKLI
jgi:hypothetical protein